MTGTNFVSQNGLMFAYDPKGTYTNTAKMNERSKSNIAPTRAQRENIRQKVLKDQMRYDRFQRVKLNEVQFKMGERKGSNQKSGIEIQSSKIFDSDTSNNLMLDDVF